MPALWLQIVFGCALVGLVGAIGAGLAGHVRVLEILRTQYPQTWHELGCPRLIQIGWRQIRTNSQQRLRRYIELQHYRNTNNPAFIALCTRQRRMLYLQMAAFMLLLMTGLALSLSG